MRCCATNPDRWAPGTCVRDNGHDGPHYIAPCKGQAMGILWLDTTPSPDVPPTWEATQ